MKISKIILVLVVFFFGIGNAFAEVKGDVNGDGKIGLEEAVYALQVTAGVRTEPVEPPVYTDSTIVINSVGAQLFFGSDFFQGFTGSKKLSDIDGKVWWNSDRTGGWENQATLSGNITSDTNGNLICVINGMPNNDKGTFSCRTKTGEWIWLIPTKWKIGNNIIINNDGLLIYSFSGAPAYTEPKISISSAGTQLFFGSNCFYGFTGEKKITDVIATIWWNSDRTGWENQATLSGTITSDTSGNLICRVEGMPNNDRGTFSCKTKTGETLWLMPAGWKLEGSITINQEGLLVYSF